MGMKNILKLYYKYRYRNHPKENMLYAITDGAYKGITFMIFDLKTHEKLDDYLTLAFGEGADFPGGMKLFKIPEHALFEGFTHGVIQIVRKTPTWLNKMLYLEYKTRINLQEKP